MTTPYDPPRISASEGTESLSFHFAPFRWWHVVLACVSFALPFLFNVLYDPIDENWTVKTFGCSCPHLDGSYRAFNANHFNAIVWTSVFLCSAYSWFRFCWGVILPRPPARLVLAPLAIVGFICLRLYASGFWI